MWSGGHGIKPLANFRHIGTRLRGHQSRYLLGHRHLLHLPSHYQSAPAAIAVVANDATESITFSQRWWSCDVYGLFSTHTPDITCQHGTHDRFSLQCSFSCYFPLLSAPDDSSFGCFFSN